MSKTSRAVPWPVVSAVAALAGAAFCGPAAAQVTLQAQALFEGQYSASRYIGVQVDATSTASVEGRVEALFRDSKPRVVYAQPVELPEGAHKRLTLYVRPLDYQSEVEVRFATRRGVIASTKAPLVHNDPQSLVVYAIHDQGSGYHFIRSIDTSKWPPPPPPPMRGGFAMRGGYGGPSGPTPTPIVAYTDTVNMPDQWKGYDAARLVILDDFSPATLSTEQQNALSEWVAMGGSLFVSGGENFERLRSPFLADMLPVEVASSRATESVGALSEKFGGAMPPGTPVVTVCRTRLGAETLVSQGTMPLLVRGRYGLGTVYFAAFASDRLPVKDWPGLTELFSSTLLYTRDQAPRISAAMSENKACEGIGENPSMALPSFRLVGLFLVAYLIILVPVNYFVLKRLGKRELAWITTPAIVFVFTLIAYGMGVAMRGGDVVVYRASVLEVRSGSPTGLGTTFFSLFSPRKHDYTVTFARPHVAIGSPTRYDTPWAPPEQFGDQDMTLLYDGADKIGSVVINMWDQELFLARSSAAMDGAVTSDLSLSGNSLTGSVHNGTATDLMSATLAYGGAVLKLGDLPAGADGAVSLPIAPAAAAAPLPERPLPVETGGPMVAKVRVDPRTGMVIEAPVGIAGPSGPGGWNGRDLYLGLQRDSDLLGTPALGLTRDAFRVRGALLEACFAEGASVLSLDEAILLAWVDHDPLGASVGGARPRDMGQTLLIVHLPLVARRSS